jgi:quercetin dioxygenase-like cupin family protein
MPKTAPADLFLVHGMIANCVSSAAASVISQISTRNLPLLVIVTLAFALLREAKAGENRQRAVRSETLLRTSSSWDGEPYKSYPSGQPELSVLKITLAPHTELEWHSHPIPNAAYIVSGELTLERKKDGKKQHFAAGQAVSETVDTFHRGVAGNEPVVLIVFYAGSPGMPLTQYPCIATSSRRRMKPPDGEPEVLTNDSARENSRILDLFGIQLPIRSRHPEIHR